MKIEEFYDKFKHDPSYQTRSRILVVRNRTEQIGLRKLFEERPHQLGWVRFSKCVSEATFIPPPEHVFAAVRQKISDENAAGKMAFVTGLSAMLAIWDCAGKMAAFEQVRNLIDDVGLRFLLFVNGFGDEAQQAFAHPRYEEGRCIIVVGEKPEEGMPPEVRLVSSTIGKFMDGMSEQSLSDYLNDYELGLSSAQPINIKIDSYSHEIAGVGGAIKQVYREKDFLRLFCSYNGGLGEDAERWLFNKMIDNGERVASKDFAQKTFFQGNMSSVCKDAPRMILNCEGEEREVLVWTLRQSLPVDCYLCKVLNDPCFNPSIFKSCYVNETLSLIGAINEHALCAERRSGIAAILQDDTTSLDAEMAEFIEHARGVDSYQIIPWLTNRTKLEKEECVRRLRTANLKTLPAAFYDALPLLKHYLAPYGFGNLELERYFTEYRELKIKNTISAEFCERAKDIQYPILSVKSRDGLLNEMNRDDTALLVVDAMGLEYLPMIVSLARNRKLDIANAIPAMVKIPTSTTFNPITWSADRRLNGIPDLDNIIHAGAHVHGKSTDEENFIAMLNVFSKEVMPAVGKALAKFKRVILTADHGASRLAVLANREKLARPLSVKGVDDSAADWRYLVADPHTLPPPSVASNLAGDYWVAKGYDRFSKSGGKLNELHGGLTYEEVLVPFVIFEKGASFVPNVASALPQEQFVENDGFDL